MDSDDSDLLDRYRRMLVERTPYEERLTETAVIAHTLGETGADERQIDLLPPLELSAIRPLWEALHKLLERHSAFLEGLARGGRHSLAATAGVPPYVEFEDLADE